MTASLPVVAGRVEHPRGEPADDLAALGVDVLQDDVGQVEPLALARQSGDQLRGVGRATADDGELHRWTPTICRAATSESCQEPRRDDSCTPKSVESSLGNTALSALTSLTRWPPPAGRRRRCSSV